MSDVSLLRRKDHGLLASDEKLLKQSLFADLATLFERRASYDEWMNSENGYVTSNEEDFIHARMKAYSSTVFGDLGEEMVCNVLLVGSGTKKEVSRATKKLAKAGDSRVLGLVVSLILIFNLTTKEKVRYTRLVGMLDTRAVDIGTLRLLLMVLGLEEVFGGVSTWDVLCRLCAEKGCDVVLESMSSDLASQGYLHQEVVLHVVGALCVVFTPAGVVVLVRNMVNSGSDMQMSFALRAIMRISRRLGVDVKPYLCLFCDLVSTALECGNEALQSEAANTISVLWRAGDVDGLDDFELLFARLEAILQDPWKRRSDVDAHRGYRRSRLAFLNALSCLAQRSTDKSNSVLRLIQDLSLRDRREANVYLKAFDRVCAHADAREVEHEFLRTLGFLMRQEGSSRAVMGIFRKVCSNNNLSSHVLPFFTRGTVEMANWYRIFSEVDSIVFDAQESASYYAFVCKGLLEMQSLGLENVHALLVKSFTKKGDFVQIYPLSREITKKSDPGPRALGFRILEAIFPYLDAPDQNDCKTTFIERLDERDSGVLRQVLSCVRKALGMCSGTDVLLKMLPLLRNEEVLDTCVEVVMALSVMLGYDRRLEKEWLRICQELADNAGSPRKAVRRSCAECLALITHNVKTQRVINVLMTNLSTAHKPVRSGCTLAIGLVGQSRGLHAIVPSLMADYAVPDALLRFGILKSLTIAFQGVRSDVSDYVLLLLPLIEDALTERDAAYRVLCIQMVTNIVLCYRVNPNVAIIVHLLNFVFPNVLDTTKHMREQVDRCLDAFCSVLGCMPIYKYIVQGIFHPARHVRNRYGDVLAIAEKHYPGVLCSYIEEEKKLVSEI